MSMQSVRGEASASAGRDSPGLLLDVAAELEAHGRQQLVGEVRLAARREPLVQRGRQDVRRACPRRWPPGSSSGPRPSPRRGRRSPSRSGDFEQGDRRQVEEPRGDHAAAAPDLGDVGQVQVVLVVLGMAQRRRLGVDGPLRLADVGVLQDVQALGVGGHDPVLDAVVDHLDEVAGAGRPAVQVAVLGRSADLLAARRARDVAASRRERLEDRIEALRRPRRRRRSSCSSRARGPRRRRSCRRRRSGCPSRAGRSAGGCRRCSRSCRRR